MLEIERGYDKHAQHENIIEMSYVWSRYLHDLDIRSMEALNQCQSMKNTEVHARERREKTRSRYSYDLIRAFDIFRYRNNRLVKKIGCDIQTAIFKRLGTGTVCVAFLLAYWFAGLLVCSRVVVVVPELNASLHLGKLGFQHRLQPCHP